MMAKAPSQKVSYPRFVVEAKGPNRKQRRKMASTDKCNTVGYPKGHNSKSWGSFVSEMGIIMKKQILA